MIQNEFQFYSDLEQSGIENQIEEKDILALLEELGETGTIPLSEVDFPSTPFSNPSTPDSIPLSPIGSPAGQMVTPVNSIVPNSFNVQNRKLQPLSSGGYIYNFAPLSAPYSATPAHFVPLPSTQKQEVISLIEPRTPITDIPSSPSIASRKEKLEKYRQKRSKRNFNRPIDEGRRERALSRTRDELGHFHTECPSALSVEMEQVKKQLYLSQTQSMMLMEKLKTMEDQLIQFKKIAETASASQEAVEKALAHQQQINLGLLKQNRLLWQTVPLRETFNTTRPDFPFSEPFKEKIDLSEVELTWTDSKILEAAQKETTDFESRWQEMMFVAGQEKMC